MVAFEGALGLVWILLWIGCFVDVLFTPEEKVRSLPKLAWIFIVLLFMLLGSIAWLIAGRPWDRRPVPAGRGDGLRQTRIAPRPQRGPSLAPDDDPEFLAHLRKRADELKRQREQGEDGPAS